MRVVMGMGMGMGVGAPGVVAGSACRHRRPKPKKLRRANPHPASLAPKITPAKQVVAQKSSIACLCLFSILFSIEKIQTSTNPHSPDLLLFRRRQLVAGILCRYTRIPPLILVSARSDVLLRISLLEPIFCRQAGIIHHPRGERLTSSFSTWAPSPLLSESPHRPPNRTDQI